MDVNRLKFIIKALDFDRISDWEEDFLISIEEQFKRKGNLTEKQEEIAEQIFRRQSQLPTDYKPVACSSNSHKGGLR